jgi:heme/copper-type cytochrome/quinol oxidase subunit 1
LSFQEWLYRKAEQNAHSEILAFLMMVLGMNLLMGGLIVTVITAGEPNLLFYLTQPLSQSAVLGLILTITGFLVLSAGFIMVVHYDRQRSWHLKEIEKSTHFRNRKITIKTQDELLKGLADESSEK